MTDTEKHQQAVKQKNCLECHDIGKLKYHKQEDECTKCHRIQRG
jgi:DNA replication protein DnaC